MKSSFLKPKINCTHLYFYFLKTHYVYMDSSGSMVRRPQRGSDSRDGQVNLVSHAGLDIIAVQGNEREREGKHGDVTGPGRRPPYPEARKLQRCRKKSSTPLVGNQLHVNIG